MGGRSAAIGGGGRIVGCRWQAAGGEVAGGLVVVGGRWMAERADGVREEGGEKGRIAKE